MNDHDRDEPEDKPPILRINSEDAEILNIDWATRAVTINGAFMGTLSNEYVIYRGLTFEEMKRVELAGWPEECE